MKTIIDFGRNGNIGLVMVDEKNINKTCVANLYATIAYHISDEYAGWEYFAHFMRRFGIDWQYFSSENDEEIDKSIAIRQVDDLDVPTIWSATEFFSLMQDFEG